MAPHVSENLSRLKTSTLQLNKLADLATGQIRALSKFLDELNPGIEIKDSLYFTNGREANLNGVRSHAVYMLAYARDDNDKFGLVVIADATESYEDQENRTHIKKDDYGEDVYSTVWVSRLDQVSRQLRINAVARLPEFIAQLREKFEQSVSQIQSNLEKFMEASAELESALSEKPEQTPREVGMSNAMESVRNDARMKNSK